MEECLVKELEWLGEGVEVTLLEKKYFVQVRLVLQIYDTPQLVSIIKRKSMLSKGLPCPICSSVKGCMTHEFRHSVFAGDRHKLPWNHALRTVGMMQRCCPVGYYDGTYTELTTLNLPVHTHAFGHTALNVLTNKTTHQINKLKVQDIDPCDKVMAQKIIDNLKDEEPFEWFHWELYEFKTFHKVLYAAYCDFRPECPFQRITHKEYCDYTSNATPDNPIHGFYKTWAFAPLKYIDYERMVNWDSFHSMKNFISNIFKLLIGDRGKEDKAIDHYKRIQAHPLLYNGSSNSKSSSSAPWEISKDIQDHVDKFFMSIIYPSNLSEHFSIKSLFGKLKQLRGVDVIQAGSVFMDLIVYAIRDGLKRTRHSTEALLRIDPYLCFLTLVGDDLCFLRRPQFDKTDIETIYNRLVELVALHHLLFGTYQALICAHQLTDLPKFIEEFGPLRGWTTLGMERAIGRIKKHLTQGGTQIHLSVMKKQIGREQVLMKVTYKKLLPLLSSSPSSNIYVDKDNMLNFSDRCFRLMKVDCRIDLNKFETNKLLTLLVIEVLKGVKYIIKDALTKSILYRLYHSFVIQRRNISEISRRFTKDKFYNWLLFLFDSRGMKSPVGYNTLAFYILIDVI